MGVYTVYNQHIIQASGNVCNEHSPRPEAGAFVRFPPKNDKFYPIFDKSFILSLKIHFKRKLNGVFDKWITEKPACFMSLPRFLSC